MAGVVGAAGFTGWLIAHHAARPAAATTATNSTNAAREQPDSGIPPTGSGALTDVALNHCQALFGRQVRVALAADGSLDQWRLHIQAMNSLVAGDITLAQATAYWNDTRIGAHRNANAFRRLDSMLRGSSLRCSVPAEHAAPVGANSRLIGCRAATSAFAASMAAARVAVGTWVHHIHDMNALRAGRITPYQATTMWTESWHTGARQLKRYDRLAARALDRDCS